MKALYSTIKQITRGYYCANQAVRCKDVEGISDKDVVTLQIGHHQVRANFHVKNITKMLPIHTTPVIKA